MKTLMTKSSEPMQIMKRTYLSLLFEEMKSSSILRFQHSCTKQASNTKDPDVVLRAPSN